METQTKKKILVIDDEIMLLSLLERSLSGDFDVKTASSGRDAARLCEETKFDLIIMDVNMPEADGFQTLSSIRNLEHYRNIPVLFLSGRNELDSKLLAFELGARDYIQKPIHTKELKARIRVHLEKAKQQGQATVIIDGPHLQFHVEENRVLLKASNAFIDLTKIECGILRVLMENPEKVISREKILSSVWGEQLNVLSRTVDAHIKKIRRKLNEAAEVIESIHGVGYRYSPAIRTGVGQEPKLTA